MHHISKWTQHTIGLVESNAALYTTLMNDLDIMDEHYVISKVKTQVNTIGACGGNSGYRQTLHYRHFNKSTESKWFNANKKLVAMSKGDMKSTTSKPRSASAGHIQLCLFLVILTKHYNFVKKLH